MHKGQIAVQTAEWDNIPGARARHTTKLTVAMRCAAQIAALCFCALLLAFLSVDLAHADSPVTSLRIYPQPLRDYSGTGADTVTAAAASEGPRAIIIDTDPGVDDAAALAWALLAHEDYDVEILGIVATPGNTDIESATHNALLIRQLAGATITPVLDIPVYMGEHKPLVQHLSSTGKMIHGLDGLWGAATFYPDPPALSEAKRQAWKFYCDVARDAVHTDVTIVALGPLTNVARALRSCQRDMQGSYVEIIVLGGAKFGGNATPVAEFNVWQDPEAAEIVLASGIDVTLIPLDAYSQLHFDFADLFMLGMSDGPLAQLLACSFKGCPTPTDPEPAFSSPLGFYLGTQILAVNEASIPDLAAVMYAFDRTLPVTTTDHLDPFDTLGPPLVEVVLRPEIVRGQTVMGISFPEKLTMILNDRELSRMIDRAIANNELDALFPALAGIVATGSAASNVTIVLSIENAVAEMRDRFLDELTGQPAVAGMVAGPSSIAGSDTFIDPLVQIFVPAVTGTE